MDDNQMNISQESKILLMQQQIDTLGSDVKELKCDFKEFKNTLPTMLDTKLELHSRSIKLYLDNSIDSHLRDKGSKMFAARYMQTFVIPIIITCIGGLIVWIFEIVLRS